MTQGDPIGLFDEHTGVWCGTHVVTDGHGREIERFDATVMCRRDGDLWTQTTTRAWPEDVAPETEFSGRFDKNGVLHYDHPRIVGRGLDLGDRTIVSVWKDPERPDVSYSSLITLLTHDQRVRTTQKIESGKLVARILVKESRVT